MADETEGRIHDQEAEEDETSTDENASDGKRSAKGDREDREQRQAEFEKFAEEQEREADPYEEPAPELGRATQGLRSSRRRFRRGQPLQVAHG